MESDQCIEVDLNDNILGKISKKEAHLITPFNPKAKLHRAFSVFLFNSENKLLLQQRASSKITFPNVWTNTCCSHPLHCEEELDDEEAVRNGSIPGIRNAAVRKLQDELGIPLHSLPKSDFKFLTRIHYFASDEKKNDSSPSSSSSSSVSTNTSHWAEHEIDYILLITADNVHYSPNPDEVQDVRYVDLAELQTMMNDGNLKWSPWFRILADEFLPQWWQNLDMTLTTDTFVDQSRIHRFHTVASLV